MSSNMGIKNTWSEVEVLPVPFQEYVRNLYEHPVRVGVRIALSIWLGQLDWEQFSSGAVIGYGPSSITAEFLRLLETAALNTTDETVRGHLEVALSASRCIQPSGLLVELLEAYRYEREIVIQYLRSLQERLEYKIRAMFSIYDELAELRRKRWRLERDLSHIESATVASSEQYRNLLRLRASAKTTEEFERYEQELARLWNAALVERDRFPPETDSFLARLKRNINCFGAMKELVVDANLKKFWRNQRFADHSKPLREKGFDRLQEMCENLVENAFYHIELIVKLKKFLETGPTLSRKSLSKTANFLSTQMKTFILDLAAGSFVVELQPLQIIKAFACVNTEVRLLVGEKLLIKDDPPIVTVYFVRAPEAINTMHGSNMALPVRGRLQHDRVKMRYDPQRRALLATFDKLRVKAVGRPEDMDESDPEEKFWLLFETNVKVDGLGLRFQAISRPIVLVSNDSQLPLAQATVFWNNAFCKFESTPFVTPHQVCWDKMAEALSTRFHLVTGVHLSEDDIHFLAIKLFRDSNLDFGDGERELTWEQFAKEPLPRMHFTFWEWCLALMTLCHDILGDLWRDSIVWGFVSYECAQRWLMQSPVGTFILKFSESALGALSIIWVSGARGRKEVVILEPFAAGAFTVRDVIERIHETEHLLFLYPSVPKEEAFRKYISDSSAEPRQYVNSQAPPEQPQSPTAGPARRPTSSSALDVVGLDTDVVKPDNPEDEPDNQLESSS